MRGALLLVVLVLRTALAAVTVLEQQQEQLNILGRSMLTTTKEMHLIQHDVLEGLADELVRVFVDANVQIGKIHKEARLFIERYNMTDEYCIEVVWFMYWSRAEEAVEAVQMCADEVVSGIEETWLWDITAEARKKSTDVNMVVLRELARDDNWRDVEKTVGKEVERIKLEWSVLIGAMKKSLERLSQIRQTAEQQTQNCTKEAIEKYEFHMGYLQYYMNKNDHCRR